MKNLKKYICLFVTCLCFAIGYSQNNQPACSTEGHRQFDFWIGEWDVYDTKSDTIVGHNHIKNILNSCVLEENWTGGSGFKGKSFNTYNPIDSTWNQVWVDVGGATYHFSGRFKNDVMALRGETETLKGKALFKLTFYYKRSLDIVQQVWEMSTDNGTTWTGIFDGTYKRKP